MFIFGKPNSSVHAYFHPPVACASQTVMCKPPDWAFARHVANHMMISTGWKKVVACWRYWSLAPARFKSLTMNPDLAKPCLAGRLVLLLRSDCRLQWCMFVLGAMLQSLACYEPTKGGWRLQAWQNDFPHLRKILKRGISFCPLASLVCGSYFNKGSWFSIGQLSHLIWRQEKL